MLLVLACRSVSEVGSLPKNIISYGAEWCITDVILCVVLIVKGELWEFHSLICIFLI